LDQYEAIFGPAGRDVKQDLQRHKRHQRWHLPDALKGHNQFLTDRVDGLITDATNSPFTRNILPYKYLENPDQKLKWNVYSFDEGIASRVPYEAAARVLPQSKKSFAGYTVRHGLAIAMEHNFMMSAAGRENFKNQLTQLVGSIQLTNDLDVHVALLQAPSYQKQMSEKYYDQSKTVTQAARQYTDLFGIMQKTPNALDFIIEDAKNHLKTWGAQPPTFLMCNGKLTTQLTMTPEKTNYLTNGPDGLARLAAGPDLPSYRGVSIIHGRKFSLDTGTAPRDLLRRKVRVAEYHHIPWQDDRPDQMFEFYDQSRDTMFRISWLDLYKNAGFDVNDINAGTMSDHFKTALINFDSIEVHSKKKRALSTAAQLEGETQQLRIVTEQNDDLARKLNSASGTEADKIQKELDASTAKISEIQKRIRELNAALSSGTSTTTPSGTMRINKVDLFIVRPNIEHEMLSVIMGRGGTQELGCTFWGQTELSCYDDAQHGIWGMSYKYHERAMVTNEKNLIRVYDVAFDGYNGGMDQKFLEWNEATALEEFREKTHERRGPYTGPSFLVMALPHSEENSHKTLPNPVVFWTAESINIATPEDSSANITDIDQHDYFNFAHSAQHKLDPGTAGNYSDKPQMTNSMQQRAYDVYRQRLNVENWTSLAQTARTAGENCITNTAESRLMAFEGTMKVYNENGNLVQDLRGSGHLGPSYPGVASIREGKGINNSAQAPVMGRLI
jgi:hypothetical protein